MNIIINISKQQLTLYHDNDALNCFSVSTASNGSGEKKNTRMTPRGKHIIRAKIGNGELVNTVFVGRRPTGEIYQQDMMKQYPHRDWILTRILWLSGIEIGKNRLANVDTMQRYIYIHGSPDEVAMGKPGSHGCVRMRNKDLICLFNKVSAGCLVEIK